MSRDDELGITRHITREGRLAFFRASKATVLFGREGDGLFRKICLVGFTRSGALFAQFTYFRTEPGVVGRVTTHIDETGNSIVSWEKGGKISTNLVKYSHPPDGQAHFSQDGSHQTQFRTTSLDLRVDHGHLFEIHAFHLEPFEPLQRNEANGRRLYLPFQSAGLPNGVSLSAQWASLHEVARVADPDDESAGPVALVPRQRDSKPYKAALLAPPATSPLKEHVLLINVHPLEAPAGATKPLLLFLGGWRKEDSFSAGSDVTFLSFTYPVENPAHIAESLGVADYQREGE